MSDERSSTSTPASRAGHLLLTSTPMAVASIVALREKYLEMQRLRRMHGTGDDLAPRDVRVAMRALAERFPGALREIDRAPMSDIESRLAELDRLLAEAPAQRRASAETVDVAELMGTEPSEWVVWSVAYHGTMRATLRVKRIARGTASPEEALARVCHEYVALHDEPPIHWFDIETLAQVLRPRAGRLNPWVLEEIARAHATTSDRIERLLFF